MRPLTKTANYTSTHCEQLSLRITKEQIERLEKISNKIYGPRSSAIRMVIEKGLIEVENMFGITNETPTP